MYSVVTANDPKEGRTLLSFLNLDDEKITEEFQAFLTCFTFNQECLNQFRLYGKENNQEATGISLIINKNYFKQSADKTMEFEDNEADNTLEFEDNDNNITPEFDYDNLPLFRCIYIDPITKQIISIGQKEDYTFFRDKQMTEKKNELSSEEIAEVIEKIANYKQYISAIQNDVTKELNELKKLVENYHSELEQGIIRKLLLNLRYLVKPVAFKEEQECRIFSIEKLSNEEMKIRLSDDRSRMYIEGNSIRDYICKIYFGPKTNGYRLFIDNLYLKSLEKVECNKSTHNYL